MPLIAQILLVTAALAAAALAGSHHARRREHPRFVHHGIGYVVVAVLAAVSLIVFGPK